MGRPTNIAVIERNTRAYGKFRIVSEGLRPGARPARCAPLEVDDADRRRLTCRHYGGCVTYAASEGWLSFDCAGCDLREELTAEEQRRDVEGLAMFLRALGLAT